jgi:Pyruvate/2-oxoacid:ferredoxin oxidoreductase gamma subunit
MPFPLSVWETVIKKAVPVKTIEINLAAFEKGREIIEGKV